MTVPMGRDAIVAEIGEILHEFVHPPGRPIDPGDHLVFDLEVQDDDFTFEVIPEVRRRFGIDPPAFAWEFVATVADVVALVERYQSRPQSAAERARDEIYRRETADAVSLSGAKLLAAVGFAVGAHLAGLEVAALFVFGIPIYTIVVWLRDSRQTRRERDNWKARRAGERLAAELSRT